jgi:tetratricopeptide (TPR) repeat protein
MAKSGWKPFPYAEKAYDYAGAALKKAWPDLHRGDCEPFPDAAWVKKAMAAAPKLAIKDADKAAEALQAAWRAYHAGDFAGAVEQGVAIGPLGYNVANKAANIYATYLKTDDRRKLDIFQESAARAEKLQAIAKDMPNAFYFHAQALGRYGQGISVGKALAMGLGGKIKASLEKAIALEPKHADAHIALGAYNAEVVGKVGGLVAGLTYGASKDGAIKHFETARKLIPDSAIARIEHANGMVTLFGKTKLDAATKLYAEAAACKPRDAMERLDVESAKEELAD